MTKRHVTLPNEMEASLEEFIAEVDERLASDEDTCDVVEEVLVDLHGDREAILAGVEQRLRPALFDPETATWTADYRRIRLVAKR